MGVFSQERNEEVNIIAPYKPSISDAMKLGFSPEVSPGEAQEYEYQFNYIDRQLFAPLTLDPVTPARYSKMREADLLRNYIKGGFGNYTTPYVELFAGSRRSDRFQVSARLKHLSSQGRIKDYGPSAYSKNEAEVNGKLFLENHTLSGKLDYKRDVYHFYGFQPDSFPALEVDKDSLRQRFQNIGAGASFTSNYEDPMKFAHGISLEYYNFSDRFKSTENYVNAGIELAKGFNLFRDFPPSVIGLDLGLDYFNRKDSSNTNSPMYFNARPWVDLNFDQYRLNIGVQLVFENDSSSSFYFIPVVSGEITLIPGSLKVFAELKGDYELNSFRSFARENPFIVSDPEIRNTLSRIGFGGGIAGNAGGFNYYARAYYRNVKDMAFYVNDTSLLLLNRFEVIYDDVNEFSLEVGGGYDIPKTMHVLLSGAFYGYNMKNEIKPWHKPSFRVTLDGSYTFLEKYTIDAAIFLVGPAPYRYFDAGQLSSGQLDTRFDLNAGFNYQHNQYFSAFLKLNNILNQGYELWYRYPTQGFQVMAGLGFSF
jgi:hypothetical protein